MERLKPYRQRKWHAQSTVLQVIDFLSVRFMLNANKNKKMFAFIFLAIL